MKNEQGSKLSRLEGEKILGMDNNSEFNFLRILKNHSEIFAPKIGATPMFKTPALIFWVSTPCQNEILNLYQIIQIITNFQLKSNLPRFLYPLSLIVYALYVSLHLSRLIYQRNDILSNNFSLYFPHCTPPPPFTTHFNAVVLSQMYTHNKKLYQKKRLRCMRKIDFDINFYGILKHSIKGKRRKAQIGNCFYIGEKDSIDNDNNDWWKKVGGEIEKYEKLYFIAPLALLILFFDKRLILPLLETFFAFYDFIFLCFYH